MDDDLTKFCEDFLNFYQKLSPWEMQQMSHRMAYASLMQNEPRMLSKWKVIAPTVHDYFGLSAEDRANALEAARLSPRRALRCYRAIIATLTPHMPAGTRG